MRRLVNLIPWKRRRAERDLGRELRYHLERRVEDLKPSGLSDAEAHRRAVLELGGVAQVQEAVREAWTWRWLDVARQDSRAAVRSLRRRPRLCVACIAILGLAVGVPTATFTLVDALILRPLPFENPDELATVFMGTSEGGPNAGTDVFQAWRSSTDLPEVEGALSDSALVGTDRGAMIRAVARVTPGIFELLGGVRPVQGRLFDASEGRPGTDDRVLLSEQLWRGLYGADPGVVGRRITIDRTPVTVVGVLPSDFRFPDWNTTVWKVDTFEDQSDERPTAYVRFRPEIPRTDTLLTATRVARATNTSYASLEAHARPLATGSRDGYYRRAVPFLSGGVVLLFLVLCANVSSLLLASIVSRGRELATCAALGASRARILRQTVFEATIIGAGGIIVGAGIAGVLVSVSRDVLPETALVRSLNPPSMDLRSLIAASMAGLAAMPIVGLLPSMLGVRATAVGRLELAGRGITETAHTRFARRALLTGQIALSCTLLLGATLLVRSFVRLVDEDRGLDTSRILVVRVELPQVSFGAPGASAIAEDLLAREARAIPGIGLASWSYGTPPGGAATFSGQWTPDHPDAQPVEMTTYMFSVSPEFFPLYGLQVLRGRPFQPSDEGSRVLVSERFARALWGNLDPIGRTFTFGQGRRVVIGLVQDIYYPSLERGRDAPQWYTQFEGVRTVGMLSLRCDGPCPSAGRVTERLVAAHPAVHVAGVDMLDDYYFSELARPRAAAAIAFVMAATTLLAAAAGLFSLLIHTVASRRRELGIRVALGASAPDIRRLVIRAGLAPVIAGILAGLLGGVSLARVLTSLLFDVTMVDPANWVAIVLVLSIAFAAAAWHPTYSAVRIASAKLLRDE